MSSDDIQNKLQKAKNTPWWRVSEMAALHHHSSWNGAPEPPASRWLSPLMARETFCDCGRSFPMPMQLAEACMSGEFINFHLFMGRRGGRGGESARWGGGGEESGGGGRREDGKKHSCRLCPGHQRENYEEENGPRGVGTSGSQLVESQEPLFFSF